MIGHHRFFFSFLLTVSDMHVVLITTRLGSEDVAVRLTVVLCPQHRWKFCRLHCALPAWMLTKRPAVGSIGVSYKMTWV